jgi:hypothetical protein
MPFAASKVSKNNVPNGLIQAPATHANEPLTPLQASDIPDGF